MNAELKNFIAACPTAFHTVFHTAEILKSRGFAELKEGELPEKNGKYFVTRNRSSLIAFKTGERLDSFMITASHGDSPAFKVKDNAVLAGEGLSRLSTERYGGMISYSWMDRPLSIAGRAVVRTENGVETRLVDFGKPVAVIPSVAPHLDFKCEFDAKTDMLPVFADGEGFTAALEAASGAKNADILSTDLFLYNPEPLCEMGELITAPRLDDLACAFTSLTAFLDAEPSGAAPVFCVFDNEEVGSTTKQGAASTFLFDTLDSIASAYGANVVSVLRSSMMLSCDNAHAVHPNHPELADRNHQAKLGGGIVIKYNANQKYTSDAVSSGILKYILSRADVPYQLYANRADMRGGSTLGNIANTSVSLNTADVGIAQLAMHSCLETQAAADTANMVDALRAFYSARITMTADGEYRIK
ncbi:MAG: M18 family aminopeptidase [Clostridia bacterium]|nr:M18 family aminopeptidase [Clostridia bacterium]